MADIKKKREVKMKSIMLGLDGLSPQILNNALIKIELKSLRKIIKNGQLNALISIPPVTPIEWTSIATGVNPAKHGIWGFTKIYNNNGKPMWRYYQSFDVKFPRIFEITAFKGLNTLSINYPLTWPINGNWYTKNLDLITDTLIAPRVETNSEFLKKFLKYFNPALNPYEKTKSYIDGLQKILEEKDYDFASIILPFPDQTFHKDPHEVLNVKKKSKEIWEMIDSLLYELMRKCQNIFIVSDHGLGAYRYYANPLIPLIEKKTREKDLITAFYTINDKLSLYFNIPIRFIIKKTIVRRYFNIIRERNELYKLSQKEAWEGYETEMDKLSPSYDMHDPADVWVTYFRNDKERDIFIKLIEKDEVSKYIKIIKSEKMFRGPFYPEYPSAIIMPKFPNNIYLDFSLQPLSFSRLRIDIRTNHHIYGVFLAYGDKIKDEKMELKNPLSNYDVTPTILSSMDLPIPKGTDGKSLIENNQYYPYDVAIKIKKMKNH
jgi:predicted AlkP superfamily phosphohydrolase/phosphomutase